VSSDRVTDEHAPVKVLVPDHPVFNHPNRITDAAWEHWVQERGLYFLGERDPKYVDLAGDDGSVSVQCGSEARRAGRGARRQRPMGLRRVESLASAAGGDRRRLRAARQPALARIHGEDGGPAVSAIDVLVVGAGPAGATAARALAVGGARVTLVDRATFPRNKALRRRDQRAGAGRFPYLRTALDRIPTHWLSRLHLESPNGTRRS
jgi:ribosomal protein S11